jgi:hypothetical protein
MTAGLLDGLPLLLIGSAIFLALSGAVAVGYHGKLWFERRSDPQPGKTTRPDHLLSAALGLLALFLGFSFSMALNRYDTRRDLVVQEANALGTTWLRIQILEETDRLAMSRLLEQYVDARLKWSEAGEAPLDDAATLALQGELWTAMGLALRGESPPLLARGVMDSLNESFDLAIERQAARSAHIPDPVLIVLLVYAVLSMIMMGSLLAANRQPHRVETLLLTLLLTLAHVVILDLDRPRNGAIQVSQQPMEELQSSISRQVRAGAS